MKKSTHTPEYRILRAELKRARQVSGMSQRSLAARLKVPHSWVAKVESGERRVDVVELCWFLTACGADAIETIERMMKMGNWRGAARAR